MLNKVTVQLADAAQRLQNQRWKKVSLGKNFRGETANTVGGGGVSVVSRRRWSRWSKAGGAPSARRRRRRTNGKKRDTKESKVEKKQ